MAAIELDTTELETVIEAGIRDRSVALDLLNLLRTANGKESLPDRSHATTHGPDVTRPALAGIQAALGAS
ncbi:hypothetical protein [Streptomyces caniscabiei]|uniref:hypothetical protein n=1 Tax=Streptomyces caniscabiei TaxID=2746961 RepID=UPI0018725328|nr:hypothetical protein [Streptomyces caniscabiei]MBE4797400.1 hypothetical protein [Streptomyces caniscabiei]